MRKRHGLIFSLPLLLLAAVQTAAATMAAAPVFETRAAKIYMVEASTGTVLLARGEDDEVAPGSLAKLMTMEVVFDALERGEITPDTAFPVSEFAWRTGGAPSRTTTMFAPVRSSIRVGDLIQGVVVQNANDGCIVLAEGMAGTEEGFAARMTERARALGLQKSVFGNATGLPHQESRVTMREMVMLARHLQSAYPLYYPLYSQADFEWNRIFQRNKNPLIPHVPGVDGFGAGYAEQTGFALVSSATRGGTRLFLAMSGLANERERLEEAQRLFEWGFTGFAVRRVFAAGEVVAEADVYGGARAKVGLAPQAPVYVYAPVAGLDTLSAEVDYRGPLRAPVPPSSESARLKVLSGENVLQEAPLYTVAAVEEGSLSSRAGDALWALLFFWL